MSDFKKIGIVGLGLIGGSIAKTIKRKSKNITVYGISRRRTTMIKALREKIIDRYFLNFENLVENSDFLVICTPINKVNLYLKKIKQTDKKIVTTDVSSVKEKIVKDAMKILGENFPFIGSHPMAGSEKTGLDASSEFLFENKNVLITPLSYSDKKITEMVDEFWKFLGAKTFILSPSEHDKLVSLTSHLPHLIIFQLLEMFAEKKEIKKIEKCIGTGFIDTTRIGKSDIEMWAEIFSMNKQNIIKGIEEFQDALEKTKRFIKKSNKSKIIEKFEKGKKWREKIDEKRRNN